MVCAELWLECLRKYCLFGTHGFFLVQLRRVVDGVLYAPHDLLVYRQLRQVHILSKLCAKPCHLVYPLSRHTPLFLLLHGYLLAKYGQTIGKKLVGIRIVTVNNTPVAFPHLILKRYVPMWLLLMVPVVGGYLNLINILLIFHSDRRCGHDLIAGTKVIRLESKAASEGPEAAKT